MCQETSTLKRMLIGSDTSKRQVRAELLLRHPAAGKHLVGQHGKPILGSALEGTRSHGAACP